MATNEVTPSNATNYLVITDNEQNQVIINQPNTNTVQITVPQNANNITQEKNITVVNDPSLKQVNITDQSVKVIQLTTLGPQGPQGPQGIPGPVGNPFPFSGSAIISGSLIVTGSSIVQGDFTFGSGVGLESIFSSNGAIVSYNNNTQNFTFGDSSVPFIIGNRVTQRIEIKGNNNETDIFVNGSTHTVGIGTTTPLAKLQVKGVGTTDASIGLLIQNADASASLTVLDNGFVGIGTTNPTSVLDISGSGRFTDGLIVTGSSDFTFLTSSDALITGNVVVLGTASINTLVVNQTQLSTGSNQLGDSINDTQTLYGSVRIPTGSLIVSGALQISSSVDSYLIGAGRVGIGVTSPQRELHVDSAASLNTDVPLALTSIDTNNRVGILFGSSSLSSGRQHLLFHRVNTSQVEWLLGTTAGQSATWALQPTDDSSYAMSLITPFAIGGTARLFSGIRHTRLALSAGGSSDQLVIMSGSGNVGIGTTNPIYKLDLSGSLRMPNNTGLYMNSNTGTPFQTFYVDSGNNLVFSATASGDTYFYEGSNILARFVNGGQINLGGTSATSSPFLKILNNGNVGIGMKGTNPTSILHISGASSANLLQIDSPVSSSILFVSGSGNVGVGTTNPVGKLDVIGTGIFGNSTVRTSFTGTIKATNDAGTQTNLFILQSGVGSAHFGFKANDSTLYIVNSYSTGNITDTSSIVLTNAGNVGIGTSSPVYKLEVRGTSSTDAVRSFSGFDIYPVPDPATTPTTAVVTGTALGIGNYYYGVTFVTALGETHFITNAVATVTTSGNQAINLSSIPVSTDSRVTSRRIYRSKVNGEYYNVYLVATIADNTTTTYSDTTPDVSLGTLNAYFRVNSTTNNITVGGTKAMSLDTNNVAFGPNAALSLTVGGRITAIGSDAGRSITTGGENVFLGFNAAYGVTTGNANTYLGVYTAVTIGSSGTYNVGVGRSALQKVTSGGSNTALGTFSMYENTTAGNNTAVGFESAYSNTASSGIVAIGYQALRMNTAASNTALGYQAGYAGVANTTGVNNIFIGYLATGVSATESNRTWIGNSSTTSTWLAGNLLLGTTTNASFRLDVSGSARITNDLTVTGSLNVSGSIYNNGVNIQALAIAYAIALG